MFNRKIPAPQPATGNRQLKRTKEMANINIQKRTRQKLQPVTSNLFLNLPSSLKTILYILLFCCFGHWAQSQTLGGRSVYNFLKLSPAPQLSALGGLNNSIISNDIHVAYQNPALLQENMMNTLGADVNLMYGGIKNMFLMYGKRNEKLQANFSASVNFISYGKTDRTDASGNITNCTGSENW